MNINPLLLSSLLVASLAMAGEPQVAKLGDPDTMQALTPKVVSNCKKLVHQTTGDEVRQLLEREGEYQLPVTPKFIAIEFKYKENILYCYALKAGGYSAFKPVKLIYFTNYKPYGTYDPATGLQVLF